MNRRSDALGGAGDADDFFGQGGHAPGLRWICPGCGAAVSRRAEIGAAQIGRVHTGESKAKIAMASNRPENLLRLEDMRNAAQTPEARAKRIASMKLFHAMKKAKAGADEWQSAGGTASSVGAPRSRLIRFGFDNPNSHRPELDERRINTWVSAGASVEGGVVDQAVYAAETLHRALHHAVAGGDVGDVEVAVECLIAGGGGGVGAVRYVASSDVGAVLTEAFPYTKPRPGAAPVIGTTFPARLIVCWVALRCGCALPSICPGMAVALFAQGTRSMKGQQCRRIPSACSM